MQDQNNLIVYCEFEDGKVADVSLELLTKGRQLATELGVKLEALVIGDNLDGVENQIFPYGADVVYKVADKRLYPYTSNPHAAVLINLFKEIKPQICLMGATCIGRDLGPRVSSSLHSGSDSRLHIARYRRPHRPQDRQGIQEPALSDPSRIRRQHRGHHRQSRLPSADGNRARRRDEKKRCSTPNTKARSSTSIPLNMWPTQISL